MSIYYNNKIYNVTNILYKKTTCYIKINHTQIFIGTIVHYASFILILFGVPSYLQSHIFVTNLLNVIIFFVLEENLSQI